ncbi:MucBP domain-containing protein [Lactococcus lactis]|nr:MucBP domain-containing protein [Lactococcus lactis]
MLTLGRNFSFKGNTGLPSIVGNNQYTGKWQNIGTGTYDKPLGNNIWTSDQLASNYSGLIDADTYIWQRIGKNVTVKYLDDKGQPIPGVSDVILTGNVGENYTTDKKDISGYTFKEIQGSATGSFTDQEQTVTYVYTKNPVPGKNVTVKYLDDKGQPIPGVSDVILTGNVGENYTTDKKIFLAILSKKSKEVRQVHLLIKNKQ